MPDTIPSPVWCNSSEGIDGISGVLVQCTKDSSRSPPGNTGQTPGVQEPQGRLGLDEVDIGWNESLALLSVLGRPYRAAPAAWDS